MAAKCPITDNKEFNITSEVFGENIAYYIYSKNNNNPLSLTKDGKESKLYKDIVDISGSDRMAIRIKGKLFSEQFREMSGDWLEGHWEGTVDENGEPTLESILPSTDIITLSEAAYGTEINHVNNPFTWEAENKYKTVKWKRKNGRPYKVYRKYSRDNAEEVANKINSDENILGNAHVREAFKVLPNGEVRKTNGYIVVTESTVTSNDEPIIDKPVNWVSPDTGSITTGREKLEKFGDELKYKKLKSDAKLIKDVLGSLTATSNLVNPNDLMSSLDSIQSDSQFVQTNLRYLTSLFNTHLSSNTKVFIGTHDEFMSYLNDEYGDQIEGEVDNDTFMSYIATDSYSGILFINKGVFDTAADIILSKSDDYKTANTELEYLFGDDYIDTKSLANVFVRSMSHELAHGVFIRAINNPIFYQYRERLETVYNAVKAQAEKDGINWYGLDDIDEFIAEILSNEEFAAYVAKVPVTDEIARELGIDKNAKVSDKPTNFKEWLINIISRILSIFVNPNTTPITVKQYPNLHAIGLQVLNDMMMNSTSEDFFTSADELFGEKKKIHNIGAFKRNIPRDEKFRRRVSAYLMERKLDPRIVYSTDVNLDITNELEFSTYLDKISNQFKFVEYKGTFHKETNERYYGVTTYLSKQGYGHDNTKGNEKLRIRGKAIGNLTHKGAEYIIKDIKEAIEAEEGIKMTEIALKSLTKIIKEVVGKSPIAIYSEVPVYDHERKLFGKIDLVVVDSAGRVRIYDFKTKEKKSDKDPFSNYETARYGKNKLTQQQIDRMQQSFYKNMFEKDYGFQVHSMNTILLNANVKTIKSKDGTTKTYVADIEPSSVSLQKSIRSGALSYIDEFDTIPAKFKSLYGEKPITGDRGVRTINTLLTEDTGLENPEEGVIEEDTLYENQEKTEEGKNDFRNEIKRLRDKLEDYNRYIKFNFNNVKAREFKSYLDVIKETIEKIDEEWNSKDTTEVRRKELQIAAEETMLDFVDYVHDQLMLIQERIDEANKNPEKAPNIRELKEWQAMLEVASSVSDINAYMNSNEAELNIKDIIKRVISTPTNKNESIVTEEVNYTEILNSINYMRDSIGKYYKDRVKMQIAEFLAPRYGGIIAKERQKLIRNYRLAKWEEKKGIKKKHFGAKKEREKMLSMSEEEYVETVLKEKENELRNRTLRYIQGQLDTASYDVNFLTRWADNMLDTSDAVAAAATDLIVEITEKARIKELRMRANIQRKLTAMMKEMNLSGELVTPAKLYGWMLEDNPNEDSKSEFDKYLIRPWNSEFERDYWDEFRRISKEYTGGDINSMMEAWLSSQLGDNYIDKEGMRRDLNTYADDLLKSGDISEDDYAILKDAILDETITTVNSGVFHENLSNIARSTNERLSDKAYNLINSWIKRNEWYYYRIPSDSKYANKKWLAFIKELGGDINATAIEQVEFVKDYKGSAKADFYNLIMDIAEKVDHTASAARKSPLGYRLPAIHKSAFEEIKSSKNIAATAKAYARNMLTLQEDDLTRGEKVYTDIQGRTHYVLPLYYMNPRMDLEKQSFDIATIYFLAYSSAVEYDAKYEFLPELELIKEFLETRDVYEREPNGLTKIVRAVIGGKSEYRKRKAENIAQQFTDFMSFAIYGVYTKSGDSGVVNILGKKIDLNKVAQKLMGFTALNMLAGNVVQAIANVGVGETQQIIELIGGNTVSKKSYAKASVEWHKLMFEYIGSGDIGAITKRSKLGGIYEYFDTLHKSPTERDFLAQTKVARLLGSHDFYYFMQEAGEGFMQGRFTIAMLMDMKAYDREGNEIGSIYDHLNPDEDGIIKLDDEVDPIKSEWFDSVDELSEEDRKRWGNKPNPMHIQKFKNKLAGILTSMHGAYGELERVAMQKYAIASMGYMFRKFLVPTFKRRWGKLRYVNRTDSFEEGYYRTFARYLFSTIKDLKHYSMYWATMTDSEKANVLKATSDLGFMILTGIIGALLLSMGDDDPELKDNTAYNIVLYQVYRLQTELQFYYSFSAFFQILRSPAAVLSPLENMGKVVLYGSRTLWYKTFYGELPENLIFQRGAYKGQPKVNKYMVQLMPILKQIHRLQDMESQMQWFLPKIGLF